MATRDAPRLPVIDEKAGRASNGNVARGTLPRHHCVARRLHRGIRPDKADRREDENDRVFPSLHKRPRNQIAAPRATPGSEVDHRYLRRSAAATSAVRFMLKGLMNRPSLSMR
jgi:hypothetical protein